MNWAATEFESIDLGDPRRNRRAIRLVERLSANPSASIPQACADWADTIAAYRFFGNADVEWEPGVKTIWLGMQRILDFAAGVRFSRELQELGTCV